MILLLQAAVYFAAIAGIFISTIGLVHFGAGALNAGRPLAVRQRRGALALLCLCGIVASTAAGFLIIPALMYLA